MKHFNILCSLFYTVAIYDRIPSVFIRSFDAISDALQVTRSAVKTGRLVAAVYLNETTFSQLVLEIRASTSKPWRHNLARVHISPFTAAGIVCTPNDA